MLEIHKRLGANLPHWRVAGATYAVTFRLADSLPAQRVAQWKEELGILKRKTQNRPEARTPAEIKRLQMLLSERSQQFLDHGAGACYLQQPAIAAMTVQALQFFDGQRYDIFARCVMPNHVHVVVRPLAGNSLEKILHSWKGYTATQIRQILKISGFIWQRESYDHWIRDDEEFQHAVEYVLANPQKVGLLQWPWVGTGFQNRKK